MKSTFFQDKSEQELLAAKREMGKEVKETTAKYINEHAKELENEVLRAGLNPKDAADIIDELKQEVPQEALEAFLNKTKEIDKKYGHHLTQPTSPKQRHTP